MERARALFGGIAVIIGGIGTFIGGTIAFGLYTLTGIGVIYWLWTAIQVGSFWMFLVGLIPPAMLVTGPVGAYSLIFGVPDWVYALFG